MNKKIVLPLALLAAGAIAYFLIKKKDNGSGEVLPPAPEPTPTPTPTNPLGNSQMVKNFQIYYNRVRPIPYANLVVDGIYGKLTKAAYLEFKDRYINFLNTRGQFTNYILGLSELSGEMRRVNVIDIRGYKRKPLVKAHQRRVNRN